MFRRMLLVAALLMASGCTQPEEKPAAPSSAQRIIDMQLNARPVATPGMNGDEASAIYKAYLEQIGHSDRGGPRRPDVSGAPSSAGMQPP